MYVVFLSKQDFVCKIFKLYENVKMFIKFLSYLDAITFK